MIRLATHNDTKIILALLQRFLNETAYKQGSQAGANIEHLCKLIWTVQNYGYTWLAFNDDEPVGLLMSTVQPNMWLPNAKEMRELVWYVVPEKRTASIGGKLFVNYTKKAQELLDSGQIQGFFTTRMSTTDNVDLESRGFRLVEKTYLKD